MQLRQTVAVVLTLAAVLATSVASATHSTPKKAGKLDGRFVTAYEPCTVPNATTDGGIPACTPPVRSDPVCGFTDKGQGKFKIFGKLNKDLSIKFKAKLKGLDPGCVGETLDFRLGDVRWTSDTCSGAPCTVPDGPVGFLAHCTVDANGVCKANRDGIIVIPGLPGLPPLTGQLELLGFSIQVHRESTGDRAFIGGLRFP